MRLPLLVLTGLALLSSLASAQEVERVVFLVGEEEYGSERTVPAFARELESHLGVEVDVRVRAGREMPEPPALDEADLLVLSLRFREPSDAQLEKLDAWFDAGKPAIALRTTSHLFWDDALKGWFPPRFGGHYKAHAPNSAGTVTSIAPSASHHPILRGLPAADDMGYGGTYNAQPLSDGASVLLFGRTGDLPSEPVAWTFEPRPGVRRFYTSLGSEGNFERDSFRRMLANAVIWSLRHEVPEDGAPGFGGTARGAALAWPTADKPAGAAPDGATELFDSVDAWRHWDPSAEPRAIGIDRRADTTAGGPAFEAARWTIANGEAVARPGFGDIVTHEEFGDYHLHLDFMLPPEDEAAAPSFRGRSGVYLSGRWEIELAAPGAGEPTEASAGAIRGLAAPLVDAALPPGMWQSLDVTYEHRAGGPAHVTVWLNGILVQDDVPLRERTPYGFLEPMHGMNAGGAARFATEEGEASEAVVWGAERFAVTARFKTRGQGTLVSKCPPEGEWVPDAKALFLRGGRLVYDIGWVGAVQSRRKFNDGKWHTVVLTSDDGEIQMWVDGQLQAERDDFAAEDHDEFVFKVGAANDDFGGDYDGDVRGVRFFENGLSEVEAEALSRGDAIDEIPSFTWSGEGAEAPPERGESLSGPIRLQADSSRVRFANGWVAPLAEVDHASLIAALDDESYARGERTFQSACVSCHGADGMRTPNPEARPFATGELLNGMDPVSLYNTVANGFRTMPSNRWLSPSQTHDVVHYLRERFLRDENPAQYAIVTPEYLAQLPKGKRHGSGDAADEVQERDWGPALASQLGEEVGTCLTVRLAPRISIAYDLQVMESPGAWTGGFLDLSKTQHFQQRGEGKAQIGGDLLAGLEGYGWGHGGSLDWDRAQRPPRGPLPKEWLDYHGHYLHGRDVVLSYAIDGRDVVERPGVDASAGLPVITHRIRVAPGDTELVLGLCDVPDGAATPSVIQAGATDEDGFLPFDLAAVGAQSGDDLAPFAAAALLGPGRLTVDDQKRVSVRIEASSEPVELYVLRFASESAEDLVGFELMLESLRELSLPPSPSAQTSGGHARWPEAITTAGSLGDEAPYALDTIELPNDNPWNAWLRTSALDFFEDGRAAVSTYGGDVWIASGIDDDLDEVTWRRFAAGMFEPMGVRVIDGLVYVTCRDRITRLHDLDGDGEADFYESFFADPDVSPNFHAFNFDLQTDAAGYLYYAKSGQYTDYALPGSVLKVAPDGESFEVHCTGLRTPNGMGMSPDGRPLVSDNQGNWIPASKISLTKPGGFYGVFKAINTNRPGEQTREDFDRPVIWMPQELDSSSGGQLWVDDARFGPLAGRYLHTSFGKGWMYGLVIDEHEQGAIWKLPFQFDAGLQRLRTNPRDGQVYAVGLSGWQGPPKGKDGCLQRLRHAGGGAAQLVSARSVESGVELTFSDRLQAAAANAGNFTARRWNYRWTRDYGSAHYSVANPDEKGQDPVRILSVQRIGDTTLLVELEDMDPCDQLVVSYELEDWTGNGLENEVYLTLHGDR